MTYANYCNLIKAYLRFTCKSYSEGSSLSKLP